MSRKFRHNKLEETRGLLLQISIIISLLIVLFAFNYKSKRKNKFDGNFVEINLIVDTINTTNSHPEMPLPLKVVKKAEFPGGKDALTKYIKKNMIYPEKAKMENIQGRVYVKFTVNEYGKILNPHIIRSIDPLIDNEAVRLIKEMPDWKPAKTKYFPVKSEEILPVVFLKENQTNN